MKNKDVALAIAVGAGIAAGLVFLGRVSAPGGASAPLPCHTPTQMAACVNDISSVNAKNIGAGPVRVSCRAQAHGWGCYTSFQWNGAKECIVSYLEEGATTGIPVFVKNVQATPAACAGGTTSRGGPAS